MDSLKSTIKFICFFLLLFLMVLLIKIIPEPKHNIHTAYKEWAKQIGLYSTEYVRVSCYDGDNEIDGGFVNEGESTALNFDARNELYKISAPTLIIAGSDDKTVGNDAVLELHEGIKGSEKYIYDGLGHGAFEEGKDFYDRVLEFCER